VVSLQGRSLTERSEVLVIGRLQRKEA
jgi:hypothetical protein